MKPRTKDGRLLNDVFAEESNLREKLLAQTVHVSRRRHLLRQARFGAAIIILVFVLLWFRHPRPTQPLVVSHPFAVPACACIDSEPFPAASIVTTTTNLFCLADDGGRHVQVVATTPGQYHLLNDAQLLSLISPHPCALIQVAPNSEQLVFLNPADTNGFPLSPGNGRPPANE